MSKENTDFALLNKQSQYIIEHIDMAVEKGWIQVYYQPVIRTFTGEVCGMEALARWQDPEFGLLSPAVFIPVLEENKLIHKLDISVIRQVCRDLAEAAEKKESKVPVSFNLSGLDFELCDIYHIILEEVKKNRISHELLHVEITESVLTESEERMQEAVRRFHDAGFQVWMDDFGSGYSSFHVLKDFDFDLLKIDMRFLENMSEKSRKIIASIVNMAKSIGLSTQAEGVETAENLEFLKEIGCERAQGYLVSKPRPLQELKQYLQDQGYRYEPENRQSFYNKVGEVNLLSARPLAVRGDRVEKAEFQSDIAVCVIEISGFHYKKILSNGRFVQFLQDIGILGDEEFEKAINHPSSRYYNAFREFAVKLSEAGGEIRQMDFLYNEHMISIHGRLLSRVGGYQAVLLTVVDQLVVDKGSKIQMLNDALLRLSKTFEHIDYLDIREDRAESIMNTAQYHMDCTGHSLRELILDFAMEEVHPEDRYRYFSLYELETLARRVEDSPVGMISDCIRLRQLDGTYQWRLFLISSVTEGNHDQFIQYIRYTGRNDLERMTGKRTDELTDGITEENKDHFYRLLVHNLLHDVDIGMFCKNKERRFVAVNNAFMSYYGFRSTAEVLGKTDEEMGWHVNPDPFMNDEWKVLNEGKTIKLAPGTCISQGVVRDIAAFKMPLYENNEIVGLIGFFVDMTGNKQRMEILRLSEYQDFITGALNITGLMRSSLHYRDSYLLRNMDFALLLLRISGYTRLKDEYGLEIAHEFARKAFGIINETIGARCSIGYLGAGDFAVLMQVESKEEIEKTADEICEKADKVTVMDGVFWTLYMRSTYILRSESENIEDMFEEAIRRIS